MVVNYAKAFIAISAMIDGNFHDDAIATAAAMIDWPEQAANELGDDEIDEMVAVMTTYHQTLGSMYGN